MSEKTIHLFVVEEKGVTGYSINEDEIRVSIDWETYDKFERDIKKFGMDVGDALGHGLLTLLKSGLP